MNREDFDILKTGIIYFDNGATTFKPRQVVNSIVDYYTKYTANAHRGDYKNSLIVDEKYEGVRKKVKDFINASYEKEVIFTSGATDSLNRIVFGLMKNYLKEGDEVLLNKAEHASNILPWLCLAKEKGIVIRYIPLNENNEVTLENVNKMISAKTKVISLAHITNVLGDVRPVQEIGALCKEKGIIFVVDASQSIGHRKVDVQKFNIDFLAFSAHKMLGPTGVGVLYGKCELLEKLEPTVLGGGMNIDFFENGDYELKSLPQRLEAGTPNIAGVIGLGSAIDYLLDLGLEKIEQHEKNLRKYLIDRLKEIPNIVIYNEHISSSNVAFNLKDIFSQDTAIYLNNYNICVRAGNHCAKILKDEINVKNTCRISLYFYNTIEEIDRLIEVLKQSENIFKVII